MTQELIGVAAIFGLLGILVLWLRRNGAPRRRLDVVETAALGQGGVVAVVRVGSKRLLVGVTRNSITPLAELDPFEWSEAAEPSLPRLQAVESEAP